MVQAHKNKCLGVLQILAVAMFLLVPVTVSGQDPVDKLTYVLTAARIKPEVPFRGRIQVDFGESMPKEYVAASVDQALSATSPDNPVGVSFSVNLDPANWTVIATRIGNPTATEPIGFAAWLKPTAVRREASPGNRIVVLDFAGTFNATTKLFEVAGQATDRFDTNTHQLIVQYRQANFPNVVLGKPKKTGVKQAYTAAKGAKDADIYLTGTITAGSKSKPSYSLEARFAYLQSLKHLGAVGGSFAIDTKEESDFDPDSIRAGIVYEYVRPFRRPAGTGLILRSNVIGGEFNRKNTVRNLVTGLDATIVLPSAQLGETTFATVDATVGFEAGNNYRNKLAPEGIGAFWRPKFGASAYFLALKTPIFDRISFNANYEVRLPRSAEIYSEMQGDTEVFSLTRKPRHRFASDLNFLFTEAYGLSLQYRYGTLPPAFKLERPNVKLGFIIQLKQANK